MYVENIFRRSIDQKSNFNNIKKNKKMHYIYIYIYISLFTLILLHLKVFLVPCRENLYNREGQTDTTPEDKYYLT